nr:HEAT repeat domain-containing protein [Sulfobacillus harzensis]
MHHGRPGLKAAKKSQLALELLADAAYWAPQLKNSAEPGARQVASLLFGSLWENSDAVEASVLELAEDPDWEVREWAVEAFIRFYRARPTVANARFASWAEGGSVSVKRAIAVAVRGLALDRAASLQHLLSWADRLADEEDAYVRKNLGPYAIGDGLLPMYPAPTLDYLEQWSQRPHWAARWNAAMALSARRSRPYLHRARPWIASLANDDEARVRRAAVKVLSLAQDVD